jgi:hypothetical protein
MGRPNQTLVLGAQEREQLEALTRSRSMPHSLVRRARIVLLSAAGLSNPKFRCHREKSVCLY